MSDESSKKRSVWDVLKFILGSYTPPGFVLLIIQGFKEKKIQEAVAYAIKSVLVFMKKHLLPVILLLVAVVGSLGAFIGWKIWKAAQPQPISIQYSIQSPYRTDYETGEVHPLRISFRGSAAKLEDVEKEPSSAIAIDPPIEGSWLWERDDEFVFAPAVPWTIGEKYTITFPKDLFPSHIEIEDLSFEITIEEFTARVSIPEFYIDPEDSSVKRVLATITGNYAIDEASLEGKLIIRPKLKADSGSLENRNYDYTISFSDDRKSAYMVSEIVGMPADNVTMEIIAQAGISSTHGGKPTKDDLSATVVVPGVSSYVRVSSLTHQMVRNEQQKYEQVFIVETVGKLGQTELRKNINAWLLPVDRPVLPGLKKSEDHRWGHIDEMVPEVLALSRALQLEAIPNELEHTAVNSYRFKVDPKRYVYVKLNAGTRFYGGYYLSDDFEAIFQVKDFPRELEIVSEGSILALSGDKRLSMMSRGINQVDVTIGRIRPDDINHLVSQSNGNIENLRFQNYRFNEYNLTERYSRRLSAGTSSDPQGLAYFSLNMSDYLTTIPQKNLRYGLFMMHIRGARPHGDYSDHRLIMVTDLGFLVKSNTDDTRDVFVQSIATGNPVNSARVEVWGRNGNPVVSTYTGNDGHVKIPDLTDYRNEQEPVVFVVTRGNDFSFMPFQAVGRKLDYSNFDIGGVRGAQDPKSLNAFLFSDRGIYRPGDTFNIGIIIKAGDWNIILANTPLECIITDSKGSEISTQPIKLSASGFEEISYTTQDYSPTGMYNIALYVIKEEDKRSFLGSTTVKVEVFLPDTMNISTAFDPMPALGWISPEELSGKVSLKNLFGTPAAGNDVKLQLTLAPGYHRFQKYEDYRFFDPFLQDTRYEEILGTFSTGADGTIRQIIDLSKFEAATYNVRLYAEAFEKGSGRSVSSEASILISPLEYLVGKKLDGDARYINKGSTRRIKFIAIGPDLEQRAASGLTMRISETRYVSVLVRQPNGVYKYQSVEKLYPVSESDLTIPSSGIEFDLPTGQAGEFELIILNKEDTVLSTTKFSIIGAENIQRSLVRTAELEVKLDREDFKPGEEIELFIKAPYEGAGIITIERDRVYAYKWFKSTGAGTTQRIRVPDDLEGNGYVTVSIIRSLDSREIYMSPLSYGIAPFSVSKERRTNVITLDIPEEAKPGEAFPINFTTSNRGKIVVFAVDEGILQVARYKTPEPISFFFKKRALEVGTAQILDLILPEFSVIQAMAAAGGGAGGEEELARNLNPFKRRRTVPVTYWSGILDAGPGKQTVYYEVPDHFNGSLRVMAVAVSRDTVGAASESAFIRSPYIIQPNTPTLAAPGDELEISVTVTNMHRGSGDNAAVILEVKPSEHFSLLSSSRTGMTIDEGMDQTVTIRVKALDVPGAAELLFTASGSGEVSRIRSYLSVRPPTPYRTAIDAGIVRSGTEEVPVPRDLYEEYAVRDVSVSYLPMGLAKGLSFYLNQFPYGCTEQLTSVAFSKLYPQLVESLDMNKAEIREEVDSTISILQARQRDDGGFGLWTVRSDSHEIIDTYVMHFLTLARRQGYYVSDSMFDNGIRRLREIADSRETGEWELTDRSYAVYILTLNEIVTTSYIEKLSRDLDEHLEDWETSFCGLFLSGSYSLLQQDNMAKRLIRKVRKSVDKKEYEEYYNHLCYPSIYLYMVSSYFPERLRQISEDLLTDMADEIKFRRFSTFSANYALLGIDSFLKAVPAAEEGRVSVAEIRGDDKEISLELTGERIYSVEYSADAEKISIQNSDPLNLFYQVTNAGFDLEIPEKTHNGAEVIREYLDQDGNVITTAKLGDLVTVRLRFRSTGDKGISNMAIVDLIPAGFEIDIESVRNGATSGDFRPDYVDTREDRVVVFGTFTMEMQEFSYNVRAINAGRFTVPPAFAEAMYDQSIWSLNPMEALTITK